MFAAFLFSLQHVHVHCGQSHTSTIYRVLTLVIVLVFDPQQNYLIILIGLANLNWPMTPYNPRACSWCSGRPCATFQCNPSSCQLRFAFWPWANCPEICPLWLWPISWILVSGFGFIHAPYIFCFWFALASNMVCVSHLVCWGVGGPLRHIAT